MKRHTISLPLTRKERNWGIFYLFFDFLILPVLLSCAALLLPEEPSLARLNIAYYAINFLAVSWIFRRFLAENFNCFSAAVLPRLYMTALYLGAYFLLSGLVGSLILYLDPSYANLNDAAISTMSQGEFPLMAVATILLVPPVEECLFRGVLFRGLYDKSRIGAYMLSCALFSAVHLVSFIGLYTPMQLLLSFLAYLPAGFCLAVSYERSDTIFVPILIHTLVNAMGMRTIAP